ncbi:hypothetical protein P7K49_017268 [Saguinus oedipus]|uniref:Uncharacterized protein n=1 Tax=Saguinus oedipus TaxID=9490 RepID=A0ABQ9V223_SAGOE|nr:hypothetical protein P7K49_017268 [Saguinus oedipus]
MRGPDLLTGRGGQGNEQELELGRGCGLRGQVDTRPQGGASRRTGVSFGAAPVLFAQQGLFVRSNRSQSAQWRQRGERFILGSRVCGGAQGQLDSVPASGRARNPGSSARRGYSSPSDDHLKAQSSAPEGLFCSKSCDPRRGPTGPVRLGTQPWIPAEAGRSGDEELSMNTDGHEFPEVSCPSTVPKSPPLRNCFSEGADGGRGRQQS